MALHGAQGPQLGLPQMISSRVQFGVYGAMIPIVAGVPDVRRLLGKRFGAGRPGGRAACNVDDAVGIVMFAAVIVL